jgi:preprotein translocase subunit SecG
MTLYIVIAVFIVVSIAFVVVFNRQNKDLKNVRKVSGRGGDFHD